MFQFLLILSAFGAVLSFNPAPLNRLSRYIAHNSNHVLGLSTVIANVDEKTPLPPPLPPLTKFPVISISGFASAANNFADNFVPSKLFKKDSIDSIKIITDSIKFARKRFVNPETVYSGLADVIQYEQAEATEESIAKALTGSDAWVAFNVSSSELQLYSAAAAKANVKRVVFAVNVSESERGANVTFPEIREQLSLAGIIFTIVKYSSVRQMGEGKYPYRIERGTSPLPVLTPENSVVGTFDLSSQDLYRILAESVDIPKTYNNVYGVGAGTSLDSEILIYMKSQGWEERVQVALLMGDFMERMEQRYEASLALQKKNAAQPKPPASPSLLPETGKPLDKYAGFFSG